MREEFLHCKLMQSRGDTAARVGCEDGIVAKIERLTRGGFHAEVGGDTANNDSLADSPAAELHIEFSPEEGAHLPVQPRKLRENVLAA